MRYKSILAMGVAFAAGYILKSALVPSTPMELASDLEKKIKKNPQIYESVIDKTRESMHALKGEANPNKTLSSYVRFSDLRLNLKEDPEGDLAMLVNKRTGEEQEIQYVGGRTSVGNYEIRLSTLRYETAERGEELIAVSPERSRSLRESIREKTSELYNSVAELFRYETPVESAEEPKELKKPVEVPQLKTSEEPSQLTKPEEEIQQEPKQEVQQETEPEQETQENPQTMEDKVGDIVNTGIVGKVLTRVGSTHSYLSDLSQKFPGQETKLVIVLKDAKGKIIEWSRGLFEDREQAQTFLREENGIESQSYLN